jgi:hypothetical protein
MLKQAFTSGTRTYIFAHNLKRNKCKPRMAPSNGMSEGDVNPIKVEADCHGPTS